MNKLMKWITTECAWALLAVAINTCADGTPMLINFGAGGGWYEPATSGQGFSFEVVPESNQLVAYWFTDPVSGMEIRQLWYVDDRGENPVITHGVLDSPADDEGFPTELHSLFFSAASDRD